MIKKLKKELLNISEEKYRKFSSSLNPEVDDIIGARLPQLRKIAKRISNEDYKEFFLLNDDEFYELTMLEGMTIGNLKLEFDEVLNYIQDFIPKIKCWSICDCFCASLKMIKKTAQNKEKTKVFLEKYFKSKKEYELRFAYVILLSYFIDEFDYVISKIKNFKSEDYYAKMAVAWCLSMCFVKDFNGTIKQLKTLNLDSWVYKKAITKAIESYRITQSQKEILRDLRKKY